MPDFPEEVLPYLKPRPETGAGLRPAELVEERDAVKELGLI